MERTASKRRLHAGEFRVLRLIPAQDPASPLEGMLITVSGKKQLTDIEFDALSYVWGDPNETVPITIDGLKMHITRNLFDALCQFRQPIETLTLWVDAICINQADLVERSHQVKRMGTIYRQARRVHMWVGKAAADFPAMMRLLKAVLDPTEFTFCPDGYSVTYSGPSKPTRGSETSARASRAFANDQEGCIALTCLLSRPYWRRMWIFQEVILATEPVIRAGPYTISWKAFGHLDAAAENPHVWLPIQVKHPWIIPLRKALFNVMHLFMTPGEASSIHNTLQPTRHLQASDPRDKLYALIGVWSRYPSDLVRLGLDKDASINYAKPVRDVYTNFTRGVIAADGNLSVLLTAGIWNPALGPNLHIPSWVPDMRGSSGVDVRFLASYHLNHFNASEGQTYNPLVSTTTPTDHFKLAVQGIIIDRITRSICDTNNQAALLESAKSLLGYRGPIEGPKPKYISGKSRFQVLFGTLIFEHKDFIYKTSEQARNENIAWMKRLLFGFCRELETMNRSTEDGHSGEPHHDGLVPATFDVAGFLNDFKFPNHQPEHGTNAYARRITADQTELDNNPKRRLSLAEEYDLLKQDKSGQELEAYRTEYLYRCGAKAAEETVSSFFIGEKWHIGTGPWNCQAGDVLAVLVGCPTPVVLRNVQGESRHDRSTTEGLPGKEYQLVGPCYLYGMMNGEVFEQSDRGDIQEIYLV